MSESPRPMNVFIIFLITLGVTIAAVLAVHGIQLLIFGHAYRGVALAVGIGTAVLIGNILRLRRGK